MEDGVIYRPPVDAQAPKSLLDFAEALAPIAKYYVILLFFYYIAKRFNQALEREATLKESERERPILTKDLALESSEEEEDGSEEEEEEKEDEIYEELVTDGSRLVSVPGEAQVRERKGKSHPLFEGLKKIEEELRQERESNQDEPGVSWNELHRNMLKTYQNKYPGQGLRVQDDDDYDDEFKDLLQKHNVRLDELKKEK